MKNNNNSNTSGLDGHQVVPSRSNGIWVKLLLMCSSILPPTPARVSRTVIWLLLLSFTVIFWTTIIYLIWAMSA